MKKQTSATGGYFRMPNEWLRLPISPGAKVLLAHFCSAAGNNGESYYSYEQLSEIVGRSRASVCAYVKELKTAGVLKCRKQKTSNGYNYRLLISIIGWADIVRDWTSRVTKKASTSVSEKTERSVQHTERNDPTGHKNKNHKNKTTSRATAGSCLSLTEQPALPVPVWSQENERDWRAFRSHDNDPFHNHGQLPEPQLIEKMRDILHAREHNLGFLQGKAKVEFAKKATEQFVLSNKISSSPHQAEEFATEVASLCSTKDQILGFFAALQDTWQPFWKKLSTKIQIKAMFEAPEFAQHKPDERLVRGVYQIRNRLTAYDLVAKRTRNRKFAV